MKIYDAADYAIIQHIFVEYSAYLGLGKKASHYQNASLIFFLDQTDSTTYDL